MMFSVLWVINLSLSVINTHCWLIAHGGILILWSEQNNNDQTLTPAGDWRYCESCMHIKCVNCCLYWSMFDPPQLCFAQWKNSKFNKIAPELCVISEKYQSDFWALESAADIKTTQRDCFLNMKYFQKPEWWINTDIATQTCSGLFSAVLYFSRRIARKSHNAYIRENIWK